MTREEAIEELEQRLSTLRFVGGTYVNCVNGEALEMAIKALKHSGEKKVKWIEKPDHYGFFETIPVCSECECTTKYREKYKCCPNCGAKMEEEK